MRACGPGADFAIEIEVETRIKFYTIPVHVDDVDLVVAFRLDNTAWCARHWMVVDQCASGATTSGCNAEALQDGAFLLVGKNLLSHVVDHHGTFEVGYGWISAVLLSDE